MKTSKPFITAAVLGLAALFTTGPASTGAPAPAAATTSADERTTLTNSIGPIPRKLAASVRAVAPADLTGTMRFNVSLKMRDLAGLQERVGRGELVSDEELDRDYLPLQADYDRVAKWLTKEGFAITRRDVSRLAVFAAGTLAQVQNSFQVDMVNVSVDGVAYPSANSHPSIPTRIAEPVLGINGLQPFHQLHKHSRRVPMTSNSAPFLINEILTAYNAKNTGYTGAGQTIAILIDTPPKTSDVTKFWTNNSVSQSSSNLTTINVNGGTLPAVSGEETLDVEWSSGIASGAKIRVYATGTLEDNDLDNGFARIISDLATDSTIHQLSISLGLGETYSSASSFTTDAQYLATLASKGVSTFVSSGDGGSTPDDGSSTNGDEGPLQVEYYASDVSVTAVGGTSLTLNTTTGGRSGESAWIGSGGGVSIQFAKPSWQTGTGVPSGTKRYVPDVAMPADPDTGAYVYVDGAPDQYGGTSWSAPTWAGFCALINQARAANGQTPIGLLNPKIYPLLGTSNFHDITSGSNASGPNAGGKYAATTGYDQVTGIGTPDVGVLLKTLAGPVPAPTFVSFSPVAGGPVGTAVTLKGTNFVSVTTVKFNGVSATFTVNSSTQITATVPSGATTGKISITTATGTVTGSGNFTVTAVNPNAPTFTAFSPVAGGPVGTAVTLKGTNFVSVTAVKFNGVSATFTVVSPTQITTKVPAGATSGKISITTANGTATGGSNFNVITSNSPTFTSFSPAAGGPVGTAVTLKGTNFVSVTSVKFNGVSATFTVVSSTQITTTVPAGATTGKISITTANGTVTGTGNFTVTVTGPNHVVISQVYGGGGSSSATYKNDYIELFNPTASTVDLSNYSVQYGSATGTSYSVTKLTGSIAAGHYYLVAESAGTSGSALPAPNATGTIAMSGTKGKVALVSSQTAITSKTSTGVVDFVGYGTTASEYEGSGPAPAPSATDADLRGNGGRTDTNDNKSDFTAAAANPRNGNSATNAADIEGWRLGYFGDADSVGDGADDVILAGDRLTNLTKYALGLDPLVAAEHVLKRDTESGYLRLTVPKNPEARGVVYYVEVTSTPTVGSSWKVADAVVEEESASVLRVRDSVPHAEGSPRFIRLRVTRD